MIFPPLPDNERERLMLLEGTGLLAMRSDAYLAALAKVIARSFRVPMAAVTLIGSDVQVLVGEFGFPTATTARSCSFCAHLLCLPSLLLVDDARLDERFCRNPLVLGPPFIRFYAGTPIHLRGIAVGALCLMDRRPARPFEANDQRLLSGAAMAVEERLIQMVQMAG